MEWIYLSPHFDDVALSCGGLVWEQTRAGLPVSIWTICGGDPPGPPFSQFVEEHHARWGTGPDSVPARRQEDRQSCGILSAAYYHLELPDCIYRRIENFSAGHSMGGGLPFYPYDSLNALFGEIHPAEHDLIDRLAVELDQLLPGAVQVVCPLALGGHVDHRLTRAAAEKLDRRLLYYADYPYVLRATDQLEEMRRAGWKGRTFPVSAHAVKAWQAAVAAHASQISTFWPDLQAMKAAISEYAQMVRGVQLWRLLLA